MEEREPPWWFLRSLSMRIHSLGIPHDWHGCYAGFCAADASSTLPSVLVCWFKASSVLGNMSYLTASLAVLRFALGQFLSKAWAKGIYIYIITKCTLHTVDRLDSEFDNYQRPSDKPKNVKANGLNPLLWNGCRLMSIHHDPSSASNRGWWDPTVSQAKKTIPWYDTDWLRLIWWSISNSKPFKNICGWRLKVVSWLACQNGLNKQVWSKTEHWPTTHTIRSW